MRVRLNYRQTRFLFVVVPSVLLAIAVVAACAYLLEPYAEIWFKLLGAFALCEFLASRLAREADKAFSKKWDKQRTVFVGSRKMRNLLAEINTILEAHHD